MEELKETGRLEKNAVMEADFIIVLLPAGKGSHIEFGMAYHKMSCVISLFYSVKVSIQT